LWGESRRQTALSSRQRSINHERAASTVLSRREYSCTHARARTPKACASLWNYRTARNQQHQVERLTMRGKKPALAEIALKEGSGYRENSLAVTRSAILS